MGTDSNHNHSSSSSSKSILPCPLIHHSLMVELEVAMWPHPMAVLPNRMAVLPLHTAMLLPPITLLDLPMGAIAALTTTATPAATLAPAISRTRHHPMPPTTTNPKQVRVQQHRPHPLIIVTKPPRVRPLRTLGALPQCTMLVQQLLPVVG